METRYKLIIKNKKINQDIQLPVENGAVKLGTKFGCDLRLNGRYFLEDFELILEHSEDGWEILCPENVYITTDGVMKMLNKGLEHGDEISIRYNSSNVELFNLKFVLDFELGAINFDKCIQIKEKKEINIGGSTQCQIYVKDDIIGNNHMTLRKSGNIWCLDSNGMEYGVFLNGKNIVGKCELHNKEFISIAGYTFYLNDDVLYTDSCLELEIKDLTVSDLFKSGQVLKYPKFNRNTRIKYVISEDKIDILDPPTLPSKPEKNIVMSLMPAIVMLALTIVLRGAMGNGGTFVIFSVCTMSMGIITSVVNIVTDKKKYTKSVTDRKEKYTAYIESKKNEIEGIRKQELKLLDAMYYDNELEYKMVRDFSGDLFNRHPKDEDFLDVRVGTGGIISNRQVNYKGKEKFESDDDLANLPEIIADKYEILRNAPIVLQFAKDNAVGCVGKRDKLYELFKVMLFDLVTRQYYNDLKVFLIIEEERIEQFRWVRYLPHLQNEYTSTRSIICDSDSKNLLFEYLYKELTRREEGKVSEPNLVIFCYDDAGIKKHPIARYVEEASQYGVTFVFFEENKELLPRGCKQIVVLKDNENTAVLQNADNSSNTIGFQYNCIADEAAKMMVHKLAPVYCEEVSLEGTLTKNISFYEMLHIISADDLDLGTQWRESRIYETMAAPIGVKAKNSLVYLDLHEKYHGPHGLVAGTTGSGKSEILQTYILAMATLFHPYEVGFVIIDFKGGGMVNQFKELPHLVGSITNIDGREIDRSLLSIKAELRKRQALFAEYNVNHIDAYIKLYQKKEAKVPLPHLILIVDEFAELKMDQPEFMKELISAARIGRSLGVHLILATQKPSGVVDAQIWSNSKFKLCLKVQTKEDSKEVLKTPLAAEIKEPGRAYLQVGNNEIFDLFQSAYCGAPANQTDSKQNQAFVINQVSFSGKKMPIFEKKKQKSQEESISQLDAIVERIAKYCNEESIERLPGICLPPLEEVILYSKLENRISESSTVVPIGIYDDPERQSQNMVYLDLCCSNTLLIGSSQYGKTCLLQVMLRAIMDLYTPKEVSMYILDFSSMALKVFKDANHIGGVVVSSEDEKLKNLVRMLRAEVKMRKERFSSLGITSFASYREAGKKDLPHILVVVENFIALKELYPEYEDDWIFLCREGTSVGINLIFTSLQTNGIGFKYLSNFANRVALFCNQRDEYSSIFDRCKIEPRQIPGRGLVKMDKVVYEFQSFIAFEGEKEIDRVNAISEYISAVNERTKGMHAVRIPEVPEVLNWAYLQENCSNALYDPYNVPIGINFDTVQLERINLLKTPMLYFSGKVENALYHFLKILINNLEEDNKQKFEIHIYDNMERELEDFSGQDIVQYSTSMSEFEAVVSGIKDIAVERQLLYQQGGKAALNDLPMLTYVLNDNAFYSTSGIDKKNVEIMKDIVKNFSQFKVLFIMGNVPNTAVAFSSPEIIKFMKETKSLFFFDNISSLKMYDIPLAVARQFKKPVEPGEFYWLRDEFISKLKAVKSDS